jgi:hypothetical protein
LGFPVLYFLHCRIGGIGKQTVQNCSKKRSISVMQDSVYVPGVNYNLGLLKKSAMNQIQGEGKEDV